MPFLCFLLKENRLMVKIIYRVIYISLLLVQNTPTRTSARIGTWRVTRRLTRKLHDRPHTDATTNATCDARQPAGGGPSVVVSTVFPHSRVKLSIVGSLRDREVACSASDRQGSNFASCVISFISPSSGGSPGPVKPICGQRCPKARFIPSHLRQPAWRKCNSFENGRDAYRARVCRRHLKLTITSPIPAI